MARSRKFDKLFRRLAAEEEQFLQREFLAPVIAGGTVRVRIAGVVCPLAIEPADFRGWGLFQPLSHSKAKLVREASLQERRDYLQLLPSVGAILCQQRGDGWRAVPANPGDTRFQIDGLIPVQLAREVELFDSVRTRFDGHCFWFEELDTRQNPALPAYLREARAANQLPDDLEKSGLTSAQRLAYGVNVLLQEQQLARDEERRLLRGEQVRQVIGDRTESRLRRALRHAGAELVGYLERGDSCRVTWRIDGREHVSAVDPENLTVQVAGICLNGEDRKFDLASLVGVLREADGGVLAVGQGNDGIDEQRYWEIHPPTE